MKILNLYAGIGGNRKLWGDGHEVTAIEINPEIAKIYQEFFPNDKIVVGDAHQFLLDHYKEFDFIWSSPPCPTHSDIRRVSVQCGKIEAKYPDMKLYEEVILLKHFFKGLWVVENVNSYYKPLIKPFECGRHYYWSNFHITDNGVKTIKNFSKVDRKYLMKWLGIELKENIYVGKNHDHRQILRNCVHPKIGLHIFNCAFKDKQQILGSS